MMLTSSALARAKAELSSTASFLRYHKGG
jgi:hypothetical protein